jgi:formylglycine-generating enzyme required for sulfatase activity
MNLHHPVSRLAAFAVAGLFAVAAALPFVLAQPPAARRYAILVGVKAYNHADLPDLEFTERDVEELAALLEPAGYRVTLLTTAAGQKDEARRPTLANIQKAVNKALANVTKHDTVLVGLAGHGYQPEDSKESYFCPLDAKPKNKQTLLPLAGLVEKMTDSGAGVKLLLVDACRNDPESGRGRGVDGSRVESLPEGVAALFSCKPGQRAFETKKAGGGHGVFFHFVLEGLRGKAGPNDRGEVTWSRLAEYVEENVEVKAREWLGEEAKQVPNEVKNLSGRSPVVLALRNANPRDDTAVKRDPPPLLDCRDGVSAEKVRAAQEAWAKYLGRKVEEDVEIGGVKMTFVLVPPGKFRMGSPREEQDYVTKTYFEGKRPDWLDTEALHEVTLTEPFYLGKTEVTQKQYQALGLGNPSNFKGDDLPVEQVSWLEARDWAEKLTKKLGDKHLYRLPTEAEWEYSCRGGRSSSQPFGIGDGRALSSSEANFNGNYPYGGADKGKYLAATCAVGSYKPNALGLLDMHGNVWEWCQDWYGPYPAGAVTNPTGPSEGSHRVTRGGSWLNGGRVCRAAARGRFEPGSRYVYPGFRLARSSPSGVNK